MAERFEYTDLIIEKKYPLAYITINRPERRNALTLIKGGTINQLQQAFLDMREDRKIRTFIIKGAGDCFSAGFDMSRYPEMGIFGTTEEAPKAEEWSKTIREEPLAAHYRIRQDFSRPESASLGPRGLFRESLWDNPTPSIAQVDSFCLGAGLWIANDCDVVYATPEAVFAYPPVRYGASLTPWILPPWLLGRRMVMDMGLTGRFITAEEAYNCGLITAIVPRDKIDEVVKDKAMMIATVPPITNMWTKRAINAYYEGLGMDMFAKTGGTYVSMTENSSVPGHYHDFFRLVKEKGFTQAYKEQRAEWAYDDPVMNKEVARLKAKRESR